MKSQSGIERLAWQKLEAARCLLHHQLYDDAYYLAGYATELLLKARICKVLGVDDFFLFTRAKRELYRPFKVHDYEDLLLLSGISSHLNTELSDEALQECWLIISDWSEDARYVEGRDVASVKKFLESTEKFCQWIEKHL